MGDTVIKLPDGFEECSADGRLDYYVEQSYLQDEERYLEDPYPMPHITVKEAYDFQLLEAGITLFVEWSGAYDSEEYPPRRTVSRIEKWGEENYLVSARELSNSLSSKATLYISASSPQERLLLAKWLQLSEEIFRLRFPDGV